MIIWFSSSILLSRLEKLLSINIWIQLRLQSCSTLIKLRNKMTTRFYQILLLNLRSPHTGRLQMPLVNHLHQ